MRRTPLEENAEYIPIDPRTYAPEPPAITIKEPHTVNIDFGVWRPQASTKVGPAAAGKEGDFWNTVAVAWNDDHTASGLKSAKGEWSPVQVRMVNWGGGWGLNLALGVKDPRLDNYNYPANNKGGNSQVILKNIPKGNYELYLYGHGTDTLYYGDYTVTVGDHSYGRKATSSGMDAMENTKWVDGSQYVKFRNIKVLSGEEIDILIQPGAEVSDNGSRTFADAMIAGLQLVPER